ncbi:MULTISPECIES: Rrf2 family transcriptional regulator [Sphingobium]|jgi:Rrf2 family protein|uniref:Iron-sulfur cluster regulator IscR n=2 Tax=Sphingobium fuliginis (strain ATCC 27551) TaxID=336203 RepID=A0A292ZBL5_SPHSA|nr:MULTISPECIES: Rrf2 family transcriptional regulator [Sphingobium]PNP97352.1 AsnC family transcriptional regulator [Sphingobium sp. SA916]QDC38293.1 Rrf2 family transcriptional regulator [Sphingobium fuliginis ATCC 27551]QOT71308.1 Rrf2 family transcriptional regulator [Sphingobium fuliginis]UXC90011.1 Rrf2 family transcriptional regulator [Sphingobium sp. RSMS]GAY20223.1 iron-sulfur cluster regulator IscR [Sphingobium fuliginis]
MRLSSFADYAVVLMSAAARHCGAGAGLDPATNKYVKMNATTLSAETGIPLPTAQKLVSRLSAAGLLESSRGTGGGVRLSRPPAAITLADVVEAVEGPIAMTACTEMGAHDCSLEQDCRVRPHMNVANNAIRSALAAVTIASLAREVTPPPFVSGEVEKRVAEQTL